MENKQLISYKYFYDSLYMYKNLYFHRYISTSINYLIHIVRKESNICMNKF